MADSEEVSSSTPLFSEGHHYQPEPELEPQLDPGPGQELFNPDDIVDLVGGAQDALERHRAEGESGLQEPTVTSTRPEPVREPEPEPEPEPVQEQEPEPVQEQEPEPQTVREPEPEPVQVYEPEPVPIREPQPETVFLQEDVPEPESFKEPEPVLLQKSVLKPKPVKEPEPERQAPEESEVVAPGAEAGIPGPAPPAEPPAPQSDALLAAAREAAPSPAEAAAQPAVTQEPLAPASYASSPAKAQPLLLMQLPTVVELVYWRDVKTTGVVFGAALLLLLSLSVCSIVSVCSYIGLALLSVTICFRIYKGILQAIQKSDEGHPFKLYLDQEVALSADLVHKYSDGILEKLNWTIKELRRLFLVEDLVDSVKFAILMWILTYVGALFNGLTLLILGLVGAFSCPIIYEKHQAQIDHYLALVTNQVKDIVEKIQEKVPGLKRKTE
ncbi:reticulon-3-like isoform X7 [Poecilia latipinna]|uniref:reticulon-3-like isoform X7 n=1 Tax=Poecilia latipinna TaxID=48699 RepID=UPI00072E53AA|nr:PREDICTED: reticulon-3-like isoform X7 [Poecilia latipinna]